MSAWSDAVAALAPLNWWRLDETGTPSVAVDSGSVGNDATVNYGSGRPIFGQAAPFELDGSSVEGFAASAYIYVEPTWYTPPSGYSLAAWVRTTEAGVSVAIIGADTSSSGRRQFQFRISSGKLNLIHFRGSGSTNTSVSSSASVNDGDWHFVVGTWDGSTVRLYIDGSADGSGAAAGMQSSGTPMNWGLACRMSGSSAIVAADHLGVGARADEFLIFDYALSAAQVEALYDAASSTGGTTGDVIGTAPSPVGAIEGTVPTVGTVNGTAPSPVGAIEGTVPVVGTVEGVAPSPVGAIVGVSGALTGTVEGVAPSPIGDIRGTVAVVGEVVGVAPAPVGAIEGTVSGAPGEGAVVGVAPSPVGAIEGTVPVVLPTDFVNLPAPTPVNVAVTLLPTPAPVPAGVTARTIELAAQPMPTLSADLTRVTGLDYSAPASVPYGRLAVFFDGIDVTHLRDVPCRIDSWSSARPSGDTAARVSFPQVQPWDEFGTGDLAPFRKDAPVEIGILRADDSFDIMWEGFWASEGDATGEAREDTTLDCEGTFWQADHTIHIPPLHLEPTDIGALIPRALNAVPGRRYAAIPEVTTGILSRERGSQTQSVLAYVQDLLSTAWTEDGRQWTLARVAPYTYRLQLTDITTVHGTITKGAWGVEIDLQRDESTRVDAVYARGVAPSGGVWANWFWPGLDLYTPPPYLYASPATNMTIGATDAGTVSGTGVSDWQRRVNELGYGLTVDGVFNAADAQAARWVQQLRGITVDGIVGPQTWNATWDVGAQALDLTAIRLPLAAKDETEQFLYTANGAVAADNPAWDSGLVRRSIDLNFGADVTKSTARPLAQRYLDMYGEAAWTGRVTISTDPHEGTSRLEYREGMNLQILGHDGTPLLVQIADADHGPLSSTFVVDERARDAMAVDAILARDRDARRTPAARPGNPTKLAQLDRNQIVQYEDESKAGVVPRVAINGSAGLWSVLPIFVSQTGQVAKMTLQSSSPATPFAVAAFGRPITANQLAAFVPNPLTSGDGWRDNEVTLLTRYGWIDSWGEPGQRAGFSPWQDSDGNGVTGKLTDDAGFPFTSEVGGYVWIALFAAADCFIEGRLYPGVPQ